MSDASAERSLERALVFNFVVHGLALLSMAALVISAPFTRFQHAWVVPCLAALTRVTEALVAQGADIGFVREPSPGRHHKTERIARDVLNQLGPEYAGKVVIRYYP